MRWQGAIVVIVLGVLGGLYLYVESYPYRKYVQWVSGKGHDQYYQISEFQDIFLSPTGLDEIPDHKEDYEKLWKQFPLRNAIIPMPVRHPMYQTLPILEMTSKASRPQLGMTLLDPSGREVSRIYTFPNKIYEDHSQGQELFKLPYVRKRIGSKGIDNDWKDLFTHKIEMKPKSTEAMIHDLYILHLRSKLLPKETIRYGLMKDGKQALIELASADKDYKIELVLTQESGTIFSYLLKTEKVRQESLKLRAKFLNNISFTPQDESVGRLLYTEFKQLNFAKQVDQEGMLYLFSDWSQNTDNLEILKEMIYFLERGPESKKQLKVLYRYAFKRYGKTFTTRRDVDDLDDPDLALQKNIEIEERDQRRAAEESKNKIPEPPALTPDEKMNLYLKKAKEVPAKEVEEMTVH